MMKTTFPDGSVKVSLLNPGGNVSALVYFMDPFQRVHHVRLARVQAFIAREAPRAV